MELDRILVSLVDSLVEAVMVTRIPGVRWIVIQNASLASVRGLVLCDTIEFSAAIYPEDPEIIMEMRKVSSQRRS